MSSLDARRHTISDGADTPSRAGIYAALLTVRDPIPVANTTDRAQVLSDLSAAGITPDADEPVFVFRADAGAGRELEYTTDGANWWTVPAYPAAPAPQTYTPSLSGPNLGSGSSVNGWYKVRPDLTVELDIKATLGNGFSLANAVFGYPPGLAPIEAMREAPATAFFVDANGPRVKALAYCGGSGIAVVAMGANGVGTAITNSFPFTWAAGDQIRVQAIYSVAA